MLPAVGELVKVTDEKLMADAEKACGQPVVVSRRELGGEEGQREAFTGW